MTSPHDLEVLVADAVKQAAAVHGELAAAGKADDTAVMMVYSSLMQVRSALAMAGQTAVGYAAARAAGRRDRDGEVDGLRQRLGHAQALCRALLAAGQDPSADAAVTAILAVLGEAEAGEAEAGGPAAGGRHLAVVPRQGAATGAGGRSHRRAAGRAG